MKTSKIAWLGERIKGLLKGGFAHIFAGSILNKAISMISSIVVARIVSKNEYAYMNYADTIYGYLVLFSGLGMATSILKVCAGKTHEEYDAAYLRYALKNGLVFEIVASIILCGVCMCLPLPFQRAKEFLIILVVYPILTFLSDVMFCYIRAKQKNKEFAKASFVQVLLLCVLGILMATLIGAKGLVLARYIAMIIAMIIVFKYVYPVLKGAPKRELDSQTKKNFWFMSISLVVANAFSGMMPFNENLLVSNLIANEEISANFRVAGLFPQLLLLVTQAVNVYFFPVVSDMDNRGKDAKKTVVGIGLFNFALVSVCVVVGMFLSPWLITFFYGDKYRNAVELSYALWIMRGLNAGIRMIPMNMIIAVGKYKFNLIMSIVACVFQFVCDRYCILHFGIIGVAYGTIVVYFVTGIMYWGYFLKNSSRKVKQKV